jgi:hypothetical protein
MNVKGVGRVVLTFTLQQLVEHLQQQLNESQNTAEDDNHARAAPAAGSDVDCDDSGLCRETDAFDDADIGEKDDVECRHRGQHTRRTRHRSSASSALFSPAAPCSHLRSSHQQPKANVNISNISSVCDRTAFTTPPLRSTRSSNNMES